jgi:GT2 family glycosyltransferase
VDDQNGAERATADMTEKETSAKRVSVLLTCFNRREMTLAALSSLRDAASPSSIKYHVHLVDDGSTDGTGNAVREAHPEATVIQGDGSLYWNQGMRRAWQDAIPRRPDYYLWLNDDLRLLPGSLDRLLAFQLTQELHHGPRVISIGKTIDEETGRSTYGGYRIKGHLSRLNYRLLEPGEESCDTMNGNCVLIPARAVDDIGIHAQIFSHGFGDVEYGMRAVKNGYRLAESPVPVGYTSYNTAWLEKTSRLTRRNARFIFTHPKGLPLREWYYMCRTHGGWLWPANFVLRYLKMFAWKR